MKRERSQAQQRPIREKNASLLEKHHILTTVDAVLNGCYSVSLVKAHISLHCIAFAFHASRTVCLSPLFSLQFSAGQNVQKEVL